MCWMEIEAFRALPADDKVLRNMKAKQIRNNFFTKKYFFGPNSPVSKETQREVSEVILKKKKNAVTYIQCR